MSYLILFGLSWAGFYLFADFKRIPELYPTGLLSSWLGIFTDLIMVKYNLWQYHSKFFGSLEVPLLLDWSVYPVVAILYIQFFPEKKPLSKKLLYTLIWVICSIIMEWIFMQRGEMIHRKWWTLGHSFVADWIIYGILYSMYRFLKGAWPKNEGAHHAHGRS